MKLLKELLVIIETDVETTPFSRFSNIDASTPYTKISTLRSKGFGVFNIKGNICQLTHKKPFSVNGKPARKVERGYDESKEITYEFKVTGHYRNDIPREIKLS